MKDLTSGKISKNLLFYSIPAMLSILLNRTYTTVDTIMVGQMLGESGLASVGCTSGLITALSSIIWGAGSGIAIYLGMLMSKKENKKLINSIKTSILLIMFFALCVSFLAFIFYKPIFKLLEVNEMIYNDAFVYYATILLSRIFLATNNMLSDAFSFFGNPSHSLKITAISCVVNISLNFLFMKHLNLGVFGAGLATIIALIVGFLINLFALKKLIRSLSKEKVKLRIDKTSVIETLKLATPCMLQQFIMYISSVAVQPTVNSFGNASIAAYSIAIKIYDICTIFFFSTSRGLSVFCTQCYGNNKTHLLKKGMLITILYTICLSSPIIILALIFPTPVATIFINDSSSQTAIFVTNYIKICFPFIIFSMGDNYFHNFFRGVLKPNYALISTVIYTVTRIIATLILAQTYQLNGVYFGFIIAWIVEFVLCLIMFISKKWQKLKIT